MNITSIVSTAIFAAWILWKIMIKIFDDICIQGPIS